MAMVKAIQETNSEKLVEEISSELSAKPKDRDGKVSTCNDNNYVFTLQLCIIHPLTNNQAISMMLVHAARLFAFFYW